MDNFLPNRPQRCEWSPSGQNSPHKPISWKSSPDVGDTVLDFIGNTPMVKLSNIQKLFRLRCTVYAKCEYFNPTGHVYDRAAMTMFLKENRDGFGMVSTSSGSFGLSCALIGAVNDVNSVTITTDCCKEAKEMVFKALNSEVRFTSQPDDDNNGLFGQFEAFVEKDRNVTALRQFQAVENPLTHYYCTAEEIKNQIDEPIAAVVCAVESGGTVTGVGRRLKELMEVQVIAVDAIGSKLAEPKCLNLGQSKSEFLFEGLGQSFDPTVLDKGIIDKWVKCTDKQACHLARILMRKEGLLVGPCSGAVLQAGIDIGMSLCCQDILVLVLPDAARLSFSGITSDYYLETRTLIPAVNKEHLWWWNIKVKSLHLPVSCVCQAEMSCHQVLHKIWSVKDLPMVPVIDKTSGTLLGVATKNDLCMKLVKREVTLKDSIKKCLVQDFPKITLSANLGILSRALRRSPYQAIVIEQKRFSNGDSREVFVSQISAANLLDYIQKHKK